MWLGTIGITSASAGQLHTVGAGLLAMLAGVCGWKFRRTSRNLKGSCDPDLR
jgi:hypothetical protein